MPLTIADEELHAMQLTEAEARIEIAARLFDAGKLSFAHASTLARLSLEKMEEELRHRGIPRYRYTQDELDQDIAALNATERARQAAATA